MSKKYTDKWKNIPHVDDLVAYDKVLLRAKKSKNIVAGFFVKRDGLSIGDLRIAHGVYNDEVSNWEFVAHVSLKWDSCTHWYFYGEDYDGEYPKHIDAYYHLCGSEYFLKHIIIMCFGWKVGQLINHDEDWYIDEPKIEKIVDLVLEDFEIDFSQIAAFKEKNNVRK